MLHNFFALFLLTLQYPIYYLVTILISIATHKVFVDTYCFGLTKGFVCLQISDQGQAVLFHLNFKLNQSNLYLMKCYKFRHLIKSVCPAMERQVVRSLT